MLLQVRSTGEQAKMLTLSERLVRRALDTRKEKGDQPSAQEILLLVALLREQGKLEEALSVVVDHADGSSATSPIDDEDTLKSTGVPSEFLRMQPIERQQLEAKLRMDTKDFLGAVQGYDQLIEKDCDEWSNHMGYFDALFEVEDRLSLVAQQRGRIAALQASTPKSRTPYLVEMELLRRITRDATAHSEFATPLTNLTPLILKYLDMFSHKLCCFTDLEPYLLVLKSDPAMIASLLGNVKTMLDANFPKETLEQAERIEKLHRFICCRQCLRYLEKGEKDVASLRSDSQMLFELFVDTLNVNEGAKGGQREVQHGDELVLLAVHMLRDAALADKTISMQCHLDAALILQFARTCSPYNYHIKLCLMEEYRELGCFEQAIELFNDLAVKHVQLDSLSYLLTPGLYECGFYNEVQRQCQDIIKFHKHAARDAGDYSVKAYENGNYSKVVELCEFQSNNLAKSAQLAAAYADLSIVTLVMDKHSLVETSSFVEELMGSKLLPKHRDVTMASLSFNHDFKVGLDWSDQISAKSEQMKVTMYRQLMLKSLLPNLLHHVLSVETNLPVADSDLEKFRVFCEEEERVDDSFSYQVENKSWCLCHRLFEAALTLKGVEPSRCENTDEILKQCGTILEDVSNILNTPAHVVFGGDPVGNTAPLNQAWLSACSTFIVVALPVLSTILQQIISIASPLPKKKKSNNKKKNTNSFDPALQLVEASAVNLRDSLLTLLRHLSGVFESLEPTSKAFASQNSASTFPQIFTNDEKFKSCRDAVFEAMASSQKLSRARLLPLLNAKATILTPSLA